MPEEEAPAEEAAPAEAEGARQDASEDLEATRRIDFGDLKFGRNYKSNS